MIVDAMRRRTRDEPPARRAGERGAALVEFALVAPLFILILAGIIAYGGYFWRAHALQQVANDAARAAIAGLTATERDSIARAAVSEGVAAQVGGPDAAASVTVSEAGNAISVEVAYDASHEIFYAIGAVPMPDPTIRRRAAVRLGGL